MLWLSLLNHVPPQRGKATFPLCEFPAHSHFNVAADFRGQGIGFRLGVEYHDYLRAQGVKGLHAMSVEKAGEERISKYLCKKRGYQLAATQAHPLLEKVTGQKYVLQVVICDLEEEARNAEPPSDQPP
jgi:hypothetical protein